MTDSIYQWKLIDFSLELKEMIFHFSFLSFLKIFFQHSYGGDNEFSLSFHSKFELREWVPRESGWRR